MRKPAPIIDRTPREYSFGYYSVILTGHAHAECVVPDFAQLANALPHGSGIDDNWYIDIKRNGNVVGVTEVHVMDETGSYHGYQRAGFRLSRIIQPRVSRLTGPMAGRVQVTWLPGDVVLSTFGLAAEYLDNLDEDLKPWITPMRNLIYKDGNAPLNIRRAIARGDV